MKRVSLITSLVCTITLIITLVILLIMALIYNNKYNINDSIVFIESLGSDSIKDGMGFVYKNENNSSYIITNYHVVDGSNSLFVYNIDNEKIEANIIDYDSYTDVAILEIEDRLDLKEVKVGSNDVKINDSVYYFNINKNNIEVAKVLDLDNEINISASYGNSFYKATSIKGDIQSGNSGSPLFNVDNEIIGLISLKEENTDIAYYIPISDVTEIVTKLENHVLVRPNIGGVFASTSNVEVLNQYGIVINDINGVVLIEVTDNYPLSTSGLIKGDVITKINDIVIEDVSDLQREIYSYDIGDTIILEYYRNNMLNKTEVILNK